MPNSSTLLDANFESVCSETYVRMITKVNHHNLYFYLVAFDRLCRCIIFPLYFSDLCNRNICCKPYNGRQEFSKILFKYCIYNWLRTKR